MFIKCIEHNTTMLWHCMNYFPYFQIKIDVIGFFHLYLVYRYIQVDETSLWHLFASQNEKNNLESAATTSISGDQQSFCLSVLLKLLLCRCCGRSHIAGIRHPIKLEGGELLIGTCVWCHQEKKLVHQPSRR